MSRSGQTRIDGVELAGSNTLSGVVDLGLSMLLSRNTLLDVNVGFGITPDAPRMRLSIAIPVRFN